MIVSLRNNKKLLRRKNIFEKGRQFEDPEMTAFESRHRQIRIEHLSETELEHIREYVRQAQKKDFRKKMLISMMVFSLAFFLLYIGSLRISDVIIHRRQATADELTSRKQAEYSLRIQKGDFFISQEFFGEAIFHYRKAVIIFPDSLKANIRLANAYMRSCFEDYTYCDEGKKHLDRVIALYPENTKLLGIRASLFVAAGEIEKANQDYQKIQNLVEKR